MNTHVQVAVGGRCAPPTRRVRALWSAGVLLVCITGGLAGAAVQGSTSLVSRSSTGEQGNNSGNYAVAISADGRLVAFVSHASNLVPGDTNAVFDVFVHDRATGRTERASVSSTGTEADAESWLLAVSQDGRYVLFTSAATNLVPGDTNGVSDLFLRDRILGETTRVSLSSSGLQGDLPTFGSGSMSADGRYVVFTSAATNLVVGDTNDRTDVFLRDRSTNTTTRISVASDGGQCDEHSSGGAITPDGRFVIFNSLGSNIVAGDLNGKADVFRRDLWSATTVIASVATNGTQSDQDVMSGDQAISSDGRFVALWSASTNLVSDDTNDAYDAFVRDMVSGTTTRVSVATSGAQGSLYTEVPQISADGRFVVFPSESSELVPGDTNGRQDIFVHELSTGITTLESVSSTGVPGDWMSRNAAVSADGRFVAFESNSTTLVPDDANGNTADFFVRDRLGCSPTIATYCTSATTTHGCVPSISGLGVPSATADSGFVIQVDVVEGQRSGLIFYGTSGPASVPFGGGSSVRCVRAPQRRTPVTSSGGTAGACDGRLSLDWNAFVANHPIGPGSPLLGGETVWAQAWFRDPGAPGGSNLSDALWFSVCP